MKNSLVPALTIMSIIFCSCKQTNTPPRNYFAGHDINSTAQIIRDKHTKEATLSIETKGRWYLYGGASVDEINFSEPLLENYGSGMFHIPVTDSVRTYFQLITYNGKGLIADSHLPMEGGYNFRDLGGIRTSDGRYVKWGKMIRADDLHKLTDADLVYLASIPVVSVVDFRSEDEINIAPDRLPGNAVERYEYSITPGNLSQAAADISRVDPDSVDSLMIEVNELLVSDSVAITRYREFFRLLQDESRLPLLFHCSAGKDRTGLGAALALLALGVDEATVMDDYLRSNLYITEKFSGYAEQYPQLKSLFGVRAEYLGAALRRIKDDYGSVENYLTDVLDVDLERMKEMYLYSKNNSKD